MHFIPWIIDILDISFLDCLISLLLIFKAPNPVTYLTVDYHEDNACECHDFQDEEYI